MKKFIVGVVMAGSILLMGCGKTPTTETTQDKTPVENQEVSKGTAKDLIKEGKNVTCTFSFEDESSKEEGTIYVLDGNMKSTAKVLLKKENMNIEANSLTKDGYTYTRSNIQKSQGAKFKNIDNKGNEEKYAEDPLNEKELNFICKDTKPDASIFTIPSDISFIDITDYLKEPKK